MTYSLSQLQLNQIIAKIEVVKRPLALSLQYSRIEQDGNSVINKFKELFSECFVHHYAIIVNTNEKEQFILHYLQEGFTSSIITNQERQEQRFQMIETYKSSQFTKKFTVKELLDQDPKDYSVISNSCIHYVNHVKEYIYNFLEDRKHATQRISLKNLIAMLRISIQHIYTFIVEVVQQDITLSNFRENFFHNLEDNLLNNLQNPDFYYDMIYEAIRIAKNQTKMQIFGNCVIIAFSLFLTQIPGLNILLSGFMIPINLYFIWSQSDESIFQKLYKSLLILIKVFVGIIPNLFQLNHLYDFCQDLIIKLGIEDYNTSEIVIIGGCTIAGGVVGALVYSGIIAIPSIILKIFCINKCVALIIKFCTLIITAYIGGGEATLISAVTYLFEAIFPASATVSSSHSLFWILLSKVGTFLAAITSTQFIIGAVIMALVGTAIVKLKRKYWK